MGKRRQRSAETIVLSGAIDLWMSASDLNKHLLPWVNFGCMFVSHQFDDISLVHSLNRVIPGVCGGCWSPWLMVFCLLLLVQVICYLFIYFAYYWPNIATHSRLTAWLSSIILCSTQNTSDLICRIWEILFLFQKKKITLINPKEHLG